MRAYCPARICLNGYKPNPQRPTLTHKWTHNTDTHPQGGHTCTQPHVYNTDLPLHIHTYSWTHTTEKPMCPLADNQIHAPTTDTHLHTSQHIGAHTYNIYSLAHTGGTQVHALKCPNTSLHTHTTSHIPQDAWSQNRSIPTPPDAQMHTLADTHLTHIHRTKHTQTHKTDTHSNKHTGTKRSTLHRHSEMFTHYRHMLTQQPVRDFTHFQNAHKILNHSSIVNR